MSEVRHELETPISGLGELVPASEEAEAKLAPVDYTLLKKVGATAVTGEGTLDPLKLYLKEIGQTPLLTKEEETILAQSIEAGRGALAELSTTEQPLRKYKRTKLERTALEGKEAKDIFIRSNLRLVVSYAKLYQASGLPLLDLIQDGNLGLEHAVDKFNWRKGFKFSTYATWWINQAIRRGIESKRYPVHIPYHTAENMHRYQSLIYKEREQGNTLSDEDICTRLDIKASTLELIRSAAAVQSLGSLDEFLRPDESDGPTFHDVIPDRSSEAAFEDATNSVDIQKAMEIIWGELDGRERKIMELRFGLNGKNDHGLREMEDKIGVSYERIRQIQADILKRLRNNPELWKIYKFQNLG